MSGREKADDEMQQIEQLVPAHEEDLDSIMQELESLDNQREPGEGMTTGANNSKGSATPKAETNSQTGAESTPAKRAKSTTTGAMSQSLTLELSGTLNLKLGFVTGNKSVELICTDEALVCRFGDGTEVRIPTENPKATSLRRIA